MKNKMLAIGVALAAITLVAASCTAPGTSSTGTAESGFSSWWNSPATQAEVSQIEQFAFQQAFNWLTHLGATKQTREQAIQRTVNQIIAQHPEAPRADVEKAVRAQFRKAATQKRAAESGA